jgi:hypothetical protein
MHGFSRRVEKTLSSFGQVPWALLLLHLHLQAFSPRLQGQCTADGPRLTSCSVAIRHVLWDAKLGA